MKPEQIKDAVRRYWNKASCGTEHTQKQAYSKEYFEEIEAFRYKIEPEIFSFAQFTRFHGKKILEVGVGAGTDFLQWVRAGAYAFGIDLTSEAITNVTQRLALYNLYAAELKVADAELLPYHNDTFDLVYSWGVIHHSPDTQACLEEIIRVTKPGGIIKVMVYNRHSLFALYRYILAALLKGKPFQSLRTVLHYHQESLGTKAFTLQEMKNILKNYPIEIVELRATVSSHDLLYYAAAPLRFLAYFAACLFGWHKVGWFMTIELKKL